MLQHAEPESAAQGAAEAGHGAAEGFDAGATILGHVANSPADHPLIHLPAIGGIDMYGKDGALCPDLLKIPWDGRESIYLFDADVATRPEKQRSVIRFTRLLEQQGALVKWLPIPNLGDGVTGADDFIKTKGIRAFRELLKAAKSPYDPAFAKWGDDGVNFVIDVTQTVPTEWSYEEAMRREGIE